MIDTGKMRLFQLPLEVMLKNNVAISYFIDYMSAIGGGCQAYIFFYLNVEGWKVSAEQQIQAIELDTIMKVSKLAFCISFENLDKHFFVFYFRNPAKRLRREIK